MDCYKADAPKDLIDCIEEPSLDAVNFLMRECDLILVTGGLLWSKLLTVRARQPGVNAGNTPIIIEQGANIDMAVNYLLLSKTFETGLSALVNKAS